MKGLRLRSGPATEPRRPRPLSNSLTRTCELFAYVAYHSATQRAPLTPIAILEARPVQPVANPFGSDAPVPLQFSPREARRTHTIRPAAMHHPPRRDADT
eukprot:9311712-Heterocapsa_arctica.AAC.1